MNASCGRLGQSVRRVVLFLGVLACGACGKTSTRSEPEIAWHTRIASACSAAKATNKPVAVYFFASWDHATTRDLIVDTFGDGEVRALLNRDFIPLKVDRTNTYMQEDKEPVDDDAREALKVARWLPKPWAGKSAGVVVLKSDCATEADRIDAPLEPRRYAEALRRARERAAHSVETSR